MHSEDFAKFHRITGDLTSKMSIIDQNNVTSSDNLPANGKSEKGIYGQFQFEQIKKNQTG